MSTTQVNGFQNAIKSCVRCSGKICLLVFLFSFNFFKNGLGSLRQERVYENNISCSNFYFPKLEACANAIV